MKFTGKYFNGKSSAGYNAEITLDRFHIRIVYFDATEQEVITHWDTDKIHKNDFAEHDKVILKYGDFPFEYLEVSDKSIEEELKRSYPKAAFHQSAYNKVFNSGIIGLSVLVVATIGFIALCYFVIIPEIAERLAGQLPVKYEEQIGEATFNNLTKFEETDKEKTKQLNAFFKALHYKTNYNIRITVVKSDVVNAYALPGGNIVVYTGILDKMDDYRELVALLSHEFSHVELKHTTKNMCRSLSSYLLISLLVGDAGGITAVVLQNADQLKQLGYSRNLEEEADNNGMKLMLQANIDLAGMKKLFEALKKEEGSAGNVPQFLSTHPLTDNRIKNVKAQIAKHKDNYENYPKLDSIWQLIKTEQ
jgi:Zn-dependent protease with chaperone function